jgi:hypothetical protein
MHPRNEFSNGPEADLKLRTFQRKEQALYLFVLSIELSQNRSALFCLMCLLTDIASGIFTTAVQDLGSHGNL